MSESAFMSLSLTLCSSRGYVAFKVSTNTVVVADINPSFKVLSFPFMTSSASSPQLLLKPYCMVTSRRSVDTSPPLEEVGDGVISYTCTVHRQGCAVGRILILADKE